MAITRSQQAKQMLQDGGMLVQPGFGGMRQGYRGEGEYQGGSGSGKGDKGDKGADKGGDPRSDFMGSKGKKGPPGGLSDEARDNLEKMTKGLRSSISAQNRAAALNSAINTAKNFLPGGKFSLTGVLGNVFGSKGFNPDSLLGTSDYQGTIGPSSVDDDDDDRGEGEYIAPTFAQTQITPGLPAAVMPMQNPMDLNRIAYRFFADGGFLDDEGEPRQAYGLGSFVKKITRPIKKAAKATVKRVKKVAKSPVGRLALAVAAPYALGPAMAPYMASLSAAQQAALISGATTGIPQLASGEDLDFKDIALSAALSGGISKATTPAGAIDGKAFNASRASQGLDPSTLASRARVASDVPPKNTSFLRASFMGTRGKGIVDAISPTSKNTGFLSAITKNLGKIGDSKILEFAGKNPFLTIAGASALAGLSAKKQDDEKFTEMDRGPGIDIAAIRRSPFDYLAPRFAGSQFDFYGTSAANGGRIGYDDAGAVLSKEQMKKILKDPLFKGFKTMYSVDPNMAKENEAYKDKFDIFEKVYKQKFQEGGKAEPVAKKVMPLLDMGGMEKDYREEGGFVRIGRMEKADDVPARLSKNEFVFTADAVRNAGDGDVDKGAEVMYNMMKNLEAGGDVSEESQGLQGARRMFQTSQRLEEVL